MSFIQFMGLAPWAFVLISLFVAVAAVFEKAGIIISLKNSK